MEKSERTPWLRYLRWAGVTIVLSSWVLYRLWLRRCRHGGRRFVGLVPCPKTIPAAASAPEPEPLPIEITAFVAPEPPVPEPPAVSPPVEAVGEAVTPSVDDLRRIEGIGPKVAALLNEAGIVTFAQLAATPVQRLRELLQAAGLRFMDPETWPQQAVLAAHADWDGLAALQAQLKGGRRV